MATYPVVLRGHAIELADYWKKYPPIALGIIGDVNHEAEDQKIRVAAAKAIADAEACAWYTHGLRKSS